MALAIDPARKIVYSTDLAILSTAFRTLSHRLLLRFIWNIRGAGPANGACHLHHLGSVGCNKYDVGKI